MSDATDVDSDEPSLLQAFFSSAPEPTVIGLRLLQQARAGNAIPSLGDVRGVTVPAPPVLPTNVGPATSVDWLARAFAEAVRWSELPATTKRPTFQASFAMAKNMLKGNTEIYPALVALRDEAGSRLSPVLWAWWRVQNHFAWTKHDALPSVLTAFKPKNFTDPRLRAMFWKDGMSGVHESQVLWSRAHMSLVETQRAFDAMCAESSAQTVADIVELWRAWFATDYDATVREGRAQRYKISEAVRLAVERNDLGLWLAKDIVKHLKLQKLATTSLI